jgi:hypothetical protein
MKYPVSSKRGMEQTIKEYYTESVAACDEAEKAHDMDKRSVHKREVYQWCSAQVMALEELMEKLDIHYDDLEDDEG